MSAMEMRIIIIKRPKLLEKGKAKKATEYIDILIRRDPYNPEYYDMKKDALSKMK